MDGSTVRSGLSNELAYSPADRAEHLRRVAEVCKILNDQGIIVICSFISPKENIRQQLAEIINNQHISASAHQQRFHLIYTHASLDYCKSHKPEFYQKVEKGEYLIVPGIDEVFEEPKDANLILDGTKTEQGVKEVMEYVEKNMLIS